MLGAQPYHAPDSEMRQLPPAAHLAHGLGAAFPPLGNVFRRQGARCHGNTPGASLMLM